MAVLVQPIARWWACALSVAMLAMPCVTARVAASDPPSMLGRAPSLRPIPGNYPGTLAGKAVTWQIMPTNDDRVWTMSATAQGEDVARWAGPVGDAWAMVDQPQRGVPKHGVLMRPDERSLSPEDQTRDLAVVLRVRGVQDESGEVQPRYVARFAVTTWLGMGTFDIPVEATDERKAAASSYIAADVTSQTGYWSCGVNSAARLLRTLGHDVTYEGLKKKLVGDAEFEGREFLFGVQPPVLREFVAGYEGGATLVEQAKTEALLDRIDQGQPVIALIHVGERPFMHLSIPALHWLIVHGHDADAKTLTVTDTNGVIARVPVERFVQQWDWQARSPVVASILANSRTKPRTFVFIDPDYEADAADGDRGEDADDQPSP